MHLYIYFVVLELQHSTHSTRTTRKVEDGVEEEEKGRRRAKTISISPHSSLILCQRGGGVRWDGRRLGANITEDEEEGKTKMPVEGEKKTRRRSINNSICSQAGWLIALHKLQPEKKTPGLL